MLTEHCVRRLFHLPTALGAVGPPGRIGGGWDRPAPPC